MPGKKRTPGQARPLPLSKGEIWEVGRRELDISVPDLIRKGEQPEVVLVVQTGEEGGVVLGDVVTSSAPLTALAEIVLRAMREPLIGKPRRPEVLRVSSSAEAELLAASPGITGMVLEVSGCLEVLESLQAHMELQLGGLQSDYRTQATRAGELLSMEGLRSFYRIARQFYREAMWEAYGDEVLFEMVFQPEQGVGKTLYGIIIGQLGEEFGLALYPSLEALQQFYDASLEHLDQFAEVPPPGPRKRHDTTQARREAEAMAELLQVSTLCLTYTPQRDVPPPLLEEARQLKLPVASKSAFPLVMRTGEGGMRAATAVELADMYVALGAILDWDARIDDVKGEEEHGTLTSKVRAVPGLAAPLTVQTTLRDNPCLPVEDEDEDEDDSLLSDLPSLFEPLLHDEPEGQPVPSKKSAGKKTAASPSPAAPPAPDANLVYTLDVYLMDGPVSSTYTNREISRRIEVLGRQTLHDLHQAIFQAFDRWEEHLYEFNLGEAPEDRSAVYCYTGGADADAYESAGDPTTTTLATLNLEAGRRFGYTFDMGDQWEHLLEVVTIGTARAKSKYPRVAKKVGKAPPQYADDMDDA